MLSVKRLDVLVVLRKILNLTAFETRFGARFIEVQWVWMKKIGKPVRKDPPANERLPR